jgi:spermidine/putrescine-binding protein
MSLLAEEEIYVTEGWSGRIYALQEQGHDIGYIRPAERLRLAGMPVRDQGLADGSL